MELPYLFDADPQAQQAAQGLLAVAPSAEELRIHEQFMQLLLTCRLAMLPTPSGQ